MDLKCWKNGQLKPCTTGQFIAQLRRLAGWAEMEFRTRSDMAALLAGMMDQAADCIEEMDET